MKAFFIIFALAVVGGMVYFWDSANPGRAKGTSVGVPNGVVYYYGEECPHCKDVANFLEENRIAEKVNFEKKEVWHDATNAAEMRKAAEKCGLDPSEIGVPFVFAEGKCFIGTPGVEGFFKKAAGL